MPINLLKLLIVTTLIFFISCCNEKSKFNVDHDVYLDQYINEIDSYVVACEREITSNELYLSLNFNDTTSANTGEERAWSHFSYSMISVKGRPYLKMEMYVCKNALITWSTNAFVLMCTFRVDSKSKSLRIFNSEIEEFIDFRQPEGKRYFEKCLTQFKHT